MAPPAAPLRAGGTCGRMVPATSTMTIPPAIPDMKRHAKYQPNDSGTAQARKAAVIHTIIRRSVRSLPSRAPTVRPIHAPQT